MVQVDEKNMKVIKDFFSKDSPREYINPLASPTTPLHFEAGQAPASHLQQQCFENPWLQNSIQLQLLNYVRTFHGAPQPVDRFNQQAPHYSPPPQQQLVGGSVEQQHSTITLLQQRFQRLERDREMRHAKQLYSNHQQHRPEAGAANLPSTSCSCSCNLELSLPQGKMIIANNSPRSCDSGRSYSPVSPKDLVFIEERKKTETEKLRSSPRSNFKFPAENPGYKTPPLDTLSLSSPGVGAAKPETRLLLKEWKSKGSSAMAADDDDEVDTSLHL